VSQLIPEPLGLESYIVEVETWHYIYKDKTYTLYFMDGKVSKIEWDRM
jgi:hypothetical protein